MGEFQIYGILMVSPVKTPAKRAIPIVVKIAAI
jgi:hypothetical protein